MEIGLVHADCNPHSVLVTLNSLLNTDCHYKKCLASNYHVTLASLYIAAFVASFA